MFRLQDVLSFLHICESFGLCETEVLCVRNEGGTLCQLLMLRVCMRSGPTKNCARRFSWSLVDLHPMCVPLPDSVCVILLGSYVGPRLTDRDANKMLTDCTNNVSPQTFVETRL